jgi:hypothetical protein
MDFDLIGIFDVRARLRAILSWNGERFVFDGVHGFDGADIKVFLSWLEHDDPRRRVEEHGAIYLIPVPKGDPLYKNAVLQELGIQGFFVRPIEAYQEELLLELNGVKFDAVRQNIMGDLLAIPEEEVGRFMDDLKEGMGIVDEINKLKQSENQ